MEALKEEVQLVVVCPAAITPSLALFLKHCQAVCGVAGPSPCFAQPAVIPHPVGSGCTAPVSPVP